MEKETVECVQYTRGKLKVLNQINIPRSFEFEPCTTTEDTFQAIKQMKVRGAPAIAIVACLGLVADLYTNFYDKNSFPETEEGKKYIIEQLNYLAKSRPTARNLFTSIDQIKELVGKFPNDPNKGKELFDKVVDECEGILQEGIDECTNMSEYGAEFMRKKFNGKKLKVMTHCNAGALATAKYGTSVGVMKFLWKKNLLERAFCTETRPYNQGARLTAFEFAFENIPVTLICDSMVSYVIKKMGIDAVAVGADRITNNGDTANKIGTYQIAISCKHHGIPFYVVAPVTTIDTSLKTGDEIPIEERPPINITHCNLTNPPTRVVYEKGIDIFNPAFDVTPSSLIDAIFTDKGVILPDENGQYDIKKFLGKN